MKTERRFLRRLSLLGMITAVSASLHFASAQDFDDIYYNPAKDKQKEKPAVQPKAPKAPETRTYNPSTYVPTPDYPAADTYSFNTGMIRDEDEYNRRVPATDSALGGDSLANNDDFANTRRIERFHNPDVVVNTNDDDLIAYYYENEPASPSVVNIYVNSTPLWNWYTPRYYTSWAFSPYYSWWGPSWSLSWYDPWYSYSWWGPSWNWSWNWGPSWGWGWHPPYGWGHPGHHGPHYGWANNWRPAPTPSGSSRPHNWAGTGSNRRPGNGSAAGQPGVSPRPGNNIGHVSGSNANAPRPGSTRGRYTSSSADTPRWPATVNTPSSGANSPASRPASSSASRGRNSSASQSSGSSRSSGGYNSSRPASSPSSSSRGSYSGGGASRSSGAASTRSSGGGARSSGGGGGSSRGRR